MLALLNPGFIYLLMRLLSIQNRWWQPGDLCTIPPLFSFEYSLRRSHIAVIIRGWKIGFEIPLFRSTSFVISGFSFPIFFSFATVAIFLQLLAEIDCDERFGELDTEKG